MTLQSPSASERPKWKSDAILSELLARNPDASILALTLSSLPDSFYDHSGPIVCIGDNPKNHSFKSPDLRYLYAVSDAEVKSSMKKIGQERPGFTYDIVFIDHNHSLASLVDQIYSLTHVSDPGTLFLFDDAVPPTIGMAGPKATQAWWVGEVWMLPHLLKKADEEFFVLVCASEPTGLLAATGFSLPGDDEIAAVYRNLSILNTDDQLTALSSYTSRDDLIKNCQAVLDDRAMRSFITLNVGKKSDPVISTRMMDEPKEWIKPAPKFILDLSRRQLDVARLSRSNRRMHCKSLDSFFDGYLVGSDSILIERKYFDRKSDLPDLFFRAKRYGTYENLGTGIRMFGDRPVLPLNRIADAKRVEGHIMLGTPDEPDNWGMWLILGVPSVWHFLKNRKNYSNFLADVRHPWKRDLLTSMGLDNDDLIEHNYADCYRFEQLTMIRHSNQDLAITADDRVVFDEIAQRFANRDNNAGGERIYVSRNSITKKRGAYRGLKNEDQLINGLTMNGFKIVEPELLDFHEQVEAFSGARVVVGLGGAGMFNTVFCKPQTKIVTIESGTTFIDPHTNIFASMDFDYGVILGEEDLTDPRPSQRRWSLDIKPALEQILAFMKQ